MHAPAPLGVMSEYNSAAEARGICPDVPASGSLSKMYGRFVDGRGGRRSFRSMSGVGATPRLPANAPADARCVWNLSSHVCGSTFSNRIGVRLEMAPHASIGPHLNCVAGSSDVRFFFAAHNRTGRKRPHFGHKKLAADERLGLSAR